MKKTISIEGMTCQNCVKHVTEALEKVAGSVEVDLAAKQATVEVSGDVTNEALSQAVVGAGYTVTSVS